MTSTITRRAVVGGSIAVAGLAVSGLNAMSRGRYDAILSEMTRPPQMPADRLELVRYATLAANGHNTQPWRFRVAQDRITILPDFTRATPVVDPDHHHLYASLGSTAENLRLAARAAGLSGSIVGSGESGIELRLDAGPAESSSLFDAIPRRQSTRAVYDGKPVAPKLVDLLVDAGQTGAVEIIPLIDRTMVESVLELIIAGNSRQMDDPAFVSELKSWLRFNWKALSQTRDGLFSAASGNPVLPSWLGPILYDATFSKDAENKRYAEQVRSSAGLLVIVGPSNDPAGYIAAGRASQRLMLQATVEGLKTAFVNQAVEDIQARGALAALLGLGSRRPNLILRFGNGPEMPRSLRRAVSDVVAV